MEQTICVSVDDLEDVASVLPDSFFSSAVEFARETGKEETDVPLELVPFMALSNPEQMLVLSDKYSIGASGLEKLYLVGMIKLAETTDTNIISSLMGLVIKHKMIDVIQNYFEYVSYELLSENMEFFVSCSFIYQKTGQNLFMIALNRDWELYFKTNSEMEPEESEYILSNNLLWNYKFADFKHIDNDGNTVLMVAIESHAVGIAIYIIEKDLCDLNHVNKNGYDAIMLAITKYMAMGPVVNALFKRKCYNVNILIREEHCVVTLLSLMILHINNNGLYEKYIDEILDSNPNLDILQEALLESSKTKNNNNISNKIINKNELAAKYLGGSKIFKNACCDGNRDLAERIMNINSEQLVLDNPSDLLNYACQYKMTSVALRILQLYTGKIKNKLSYSSRFAPYLITDWVTRHKLTEVEAILTTREII